MKKLGLIMIMFALILPTVGCQNQEEESATSHDHEMMMGDIHELTASADELPSFLDNHHENISTIYERTPHYQDLLEHMPCYCGCGDTVAHRNTFDCFIHERQQSGEIVWDDHGAKCGVCLEIAHISMELHDQGIPIDDIRNYIDDRYKEGFPEPTDTPYPNV